MQPALTILVVALALFYLIRYFRKTESAREGCDSCHFSGSQARKEAR
ncbi:MAG: hypothetical protein ACK5XV_13205 [Flavobacteriales bacterium]|jgi:hypothetical protein